MAQPRVFVSHSHMDDVFAERLVKDLRAAGADAWLDKEDMGAGNFQQRISEALERCEWFVLILTRDALASPWVRQEVDAANRLKHQKRIRDLIFVKAGPIDQEELPAMWGIYHIFDATTEYTHALARMLAAIGISAQDASIMVPIDNEKRAVRDSKLDRTSNFSGSRDRWTFNRRISRRATMVGVPVVLVLTLVLLGVNLESQRILTLFTTPRATATATTGTSCGSYVDMGNPQSEASHNLENWGAGSYDSTAVSPSADITYRYQPKGIQAFVTLCVATPGIAYTVTTEVQDFGCDDSFEIFVNYSSAPIYRYTGTRANVVHVHTVAIPAEDIQSHEVVLGFESTSKDCGFAAVYNIQLAPTYG